MPRRVKLNSAGIAALLKSPEMVAVTKAAAEKVAENARQQNVKVGGFAGGGLVDLPVEVLSEITDRARSQVILAHPAGEAVQAKHGALTKAAGQVGLDVRSRKK